MGKILAKLFIEIVNVLSVPLVSIKANQDGFSIGIFPFEGTQLPSIDDRLVGIESARKSLLEALSAIDDLKFEANANKQELKQVLEKLRLAEESKAITAKDLSDLENIKNINVDILKGVMGVPSKRQVAIDRIVGFVLGIITSLIASFLWTLFS